ncbi:MAG: urease accessory protein UreD, partial [Rhodoferax sp.]|uniref:urease accessory protein UreD n=1 Tax=Rhodoferax sp. TaxID=50421 RepID=UPI001B3EB68B
MSWRARLQIDYRCQQQRTIAHHSHDGPLRVLQSLYPEGDGICHNVLVHPPGGLVGGDTLTLDIHAQGCAHGLITTPGASRF